MTAYFSHFVIASLTLSWSKVILVNAQYYLVENNLAYSILGSPLNIFRSSSFIFLVPNIFFVAVIVAVPPYAVNTWVATTVFCTMDAVNKRI